jgi:hypothetical protein
MGQNTSAANCYLDFQEIRRVLWNPKLIALFVLPFAEQDVTSP